MEAKTTNLQRLDFSDETPIEDLPARMRFGTLLRRERIKAGKTIQGLSALTEIHESTIADAERGNIPLSADETIALCQAIGCKQGMLLDLAVEYNHDLWKTAEEGEPGFVATEMQVKTKTLIPRSQREVELLEELDRVNDDLGSAIDALDTCADVLAQENREKEKAIVDSVVARLGAAMARSRIIMGNNRIEQVES